MTEAYVGEWSEDDLLWIYQDKILDWEKNASPPRVGMIVFPLDRSGWRRKFIVESVRLAPGRFDVHVRWPNADE
jgi:hypothetical protein